MDTLFPFGFPWPTAMYLALFIVTATVYTVCMHYAFAGTAVLVIGYLAPGARRRVEGNPSRSGLGLIVKLVRDCLPAMLGLVVITGIAPLLVLQILYKRQFYTASLLLTNSFMPVLPAIILACSMLYLIKSESLTRRWAFFNGPVTIVAFACLFYAAWAWTENHVLSIHESVWKDQYESHTLIYRNAEIWPRLGYWLTSSFSTLAIALAWQLHWGGRQYDPANRDLAIRRLRSLAILGLATSAAEAWLWVFYLDTTARAVVLSGLALPYAVFALLGMGIQAIGWLTARTGAPQTKRWRSSHRARS
jgi:hypothetical protein